MEKDFSLILLHCNSYILKLQIQVPILFTF